MRIELVSKLQGDYLVNSQRKYYYSDVIRGLVELSKCSNHIPVYHLKRDGYVHDINEFTSLGVDDLLGVCSEINFKEGYVEFTKCDTPLGKILDVSLLDKAKIGLLATGKLDEDAKSKDKDIYHVDKVFGLQLVSKEHCL